ncbi:hypothetical protein ABK040_006012 [Willaertia magna]
MKLKISYNTSEAQSGSILPLTNFVTVVPNDLTVEALKKHLELILAQRLGVQQAPVSLLTTSDGFELNNNDNLNEILKSSIDVNGFEEHFVAYDMRALFRRERERLDLDSLFRLLGGDDYVDSIVKSIKVGQHKHELILGKWNHLDDYLALLDMTKSSTKKLNSELNWELEKPIVTGSMIFNPPVSDLQKYEDSGDSDFHLMIPVDQINNFVTCNQVIQQMVNLIIISIFQARIGQQEKEHTPQPMKLKIRITDNEGKQRELIVEQANKPLDLPTLEERAESWDVKDKEFMRMVTCDDTDKLKRIFTALYLSDKEIILRYSYGTYFRYDLRDIKTLEFQAAKKEETELEDHFRESDGCKWQTFARFDSKTGLLYAFRVILETATGKREEVVLVKDLLDEIAKLQ